MNRVRAFGGQISLDRSLSWFDSILYFSAFIMGNGYSQTSLDDISTRKEKPCLDQGSIDLNPVIDEEEPLLPSSNGDASVWKATLNILNFIEGVGFLAIPFAVAKGGIAAIAALIFVPLIFWFTNSLLVECLYEPDVLHGNIRVRSSWNDIGKAMWPRYGGTIIAAVQCFGLTVTSTIYLISCGSLMSFAFPSLPVTTTAWTCISAVVVLPSTFLRSLSQIAWLSLIGIAGLLGTAVVILWYGAVHSSQWKAKDLLFWDTEGFLISLGIIMFSYGSALVVPSVEESMADKSKFGRALGLAYIATVLLKLPFAIFGFLSFSFATNEIVINNIPHSVPQVIVSLTFVLSCLFSYALPLQAAFQYIDESDIYLQLQSKLKLPSLVHFVFLRVVLVSLTLFMAILIPHFGLLTSFAGNLATPLLNFILPCVAHLILRKADLNLCQIALDYSLIVCGVFVSISGFFFSIKALII